MGWGRFKAQLFDDRAAALREIHYVRVSVLGACDEQILFQVDRDGLNGAFRHLDLLFNLVLLEVFRNGEDSHRVVVAPRRKQLALGAEGDVVQAWVLFAEIRLKLLEQGQLAAFLIYGVKVDYMVHCGHKYVLALFE